MTLALLPASPLTSLIFLFIVSPLLISLIFFFLPAPMKVSYHYYHQIVVVRHHYVPCFFMLFVIKKDFLLKDPLETYLSHKTTLL